MIDENGKELTDEELLKDSLPLLADVCSYLFECEDDQCRALAYMVDSALKYGQAILLNEDPLLSEDFRYQQRMEKSE